MLQPGPFWQWLQDVCFQRFHAVYANIHQFDGAQNMIHQKMLLVSTQWTSSCGTGMQIPAFVADEQQSAEVHEPGIYFGGPDVARFIEQ
ncbi:hypothetical protein TNCV_4662391 [Trichonephila clavipes]|uniref:Uncharacterized protein n=1 Tax=Trichonephila clavipes TaxID=2585209 RepID=A0A8X6SLC5_TRICX|nr:hypothetical protein TNCV_4662391 [Trichonephila clavipes]